MKATLVAATIALWPHLLDSNPPNEVIVWNVGQGLWITLLNFNSCIHVDMGGEQNPLPQLTPLCRKRKNLVYFSHGDRDHVSYFPLATRALRSICVAIRPLGAPPSIQPRLNPFHFRRCRQEEEPLKQISQPKETFRNASHVFLFQDSWLFPGDSPVAAERTWARDLKKSPIKYLVLGHHGSSTSTSLSLLSQLPNMEVAIASARAARYGHPDKKLKARLRERGILPLRTEDFGNLHYR